MLAKNNAKYYEETEKPLVSKQKIFLTMITVSPFYFWRHFWYHFYR